MMLNTRMGVALLALFATSSSAAAKKNDDRMTRKRHLRKQMAGSNTKKHLVTRKNKKQHNDNDVDITEDVAFWTRSLQSSFPPQPTPTPPQPTPTPPTPVTPIPTYVVDPTDPPVPVSTPPPVPSPTPPSGNAPVARDDTAQVSGGGDLAFVSVLVNDTPAAGQTLTVKSITSPASNGDCSIGLDLTDVVYMPNDGFTGTDQCTYEACDLVPVCDSATVTFTVG